MYKYLNYLPPELREIKEFQAIGNAIDPVAEETYKHTVQKYLNQFITSSDIPTVERWEKIFRITPYEDDTLETRRLRILSKFIQQLPFTWKVLNEYLNIFSDNYIPSRDFSKQHFSLKISLLNNLKLSELVSSLRLLIPSNMTMKVTAKEFTNGNLYIGVFPRSASTIRIKPYQPSKIQQKATISFGGYGATGQTIRIQPKGA